MIVDLAALLVDELAHDHAARDRLAALLAPHLPAPEATADRGLNVNDAAAAADVSAKTVRRALDAGTLRGVKVAGKWRINRADLEHWAAAGARTSTITGPDARRRLTATARGTGADAILAAGSGDR